MANRVSDKLTALHHHIYCCRSGSAADTQALSDYVRYFLASHRWVGRSTKSNQPAASAASACCWSSVSCRLLTSPPLLHDGAAQHRAGPFPERVHGGQAHVDAHLQEQGQPHGCVRLPVFLSPFDNRQMTPASIH